MTDNIIMYLVCGDFREHFGNNALKDNVSR